ncbi:amino acid permease-domain-containing protein [Fusarium flagelliforme]|uniref:High-affinity methionine permease n=1 Tax=Fusarium flagelliforme TaxID=2675880 RepID=A0A395N0X6_9HYPO|nr:amino acid permease-domain-containing protein [Fusarium flagelliforme]KAH7179784.1 amino acid permease-domain-containing protein [Fusarium flagelliforme]RFN53791.1 high-affinity methionine permease [Fusarium flagelliforme]
MDDFATYQNKNNHVVTPRRDDRAEDSDRGSLFNDNEGEIYTSAPKEAFKLGYFDVMCLVLNRMIGTGIFNSPQRVMQGTNSTGASLLLWLAGVIYCLSGVHVYIEYGLNVPRYTINGIEQSVPRSGGDLNYLQYVYRKPAYRSGTVLLSTCMFGFCFIALGNMAGNCISFATRVLAASGEEDPTPGAVRGIAIGIAILTCFIHTFSRRGGILLNNMLAMIKVMILLLIIVTAIVVGAGGLKGSDGKPVEKHIGANTQPSTAFADSGDANGYAHAFLAIIFSFSGFEQPNYVMGEISRPRRKHPVAMLSGVSIAILLYMAVNISYMVVVDKDSQVESNVAEQFFVLTLGSLSNGGTGKRIFNAFLAVSSMGNIIVMTYTAARVKQEIAKEGIIPYAKFFAQDGDISLGRLLNWFKKRGMFSSLLNTRWLSPEDHRERTPVGAFVLHLGSCFILIFATWRAGSGNSYVLLTSLSAYVINAFFGIFLGLGILILRFKGPPKTDKDEIQSPAAPPQTWRQMTGKHINPTLSVICAVIYIIGGLWPIVTIWIKPKNVERNPDDNEPELPWWLIPTITWSIIAGSVFWFLGFVSFAMRRKHKRNEIFVVEKKPEFESADGPDSSDEKPGGYVLVHETVYLSWTAAEIHETKRSGTTGFQERPGAVSATPVNRYAGTDFEAFYPEERTAVPTRAYNPGYRP